MSKRQDEYQLQKTVCRYLDSQYPDVRYLSDTIASIRLSIPQAVRNKAIQDENFKCPDLLILEPNKISHGLFIELKITSPFKINGELYKNEHLEGQQRTIDEMNAKGYFSAFCWDFDMARALIDNYMKLR